MHCWKLLVSDSDCILLHVDEWELQFNVCDGNTEMLLRVCLCAKFFFKSLEVPRLFRLLFQCSVAAFSLQMLLPEVTNGREVNHLEFLDMFSSASQSIDFSSMLNLHVMIPAFQWHSNCSCRFIKTTFRFYSGILKNHWFSKVINSFLVGLIQFSAFTDFKHWAKLWLISLSYSVPQGAMERCHYTV